MIRSIVFFSLLAAAVTAAQAADGERTAPALYVEHCAACHGADRLGGTGPALIPETLKRMRGPKIADVIANGRWQPRCRPLPTSFPATRLPRCRRS